MTTEIIFCYTLERLLPGPEYSLNIVNKLGECSHG